MELHFFTASDWASLEAKMRAAGHLPVIVGNTIGIEYKAEYGTLEEWTHSVCAHFKCTYSGPDEM